MKVILINGSPHKRGCTHAALAEVARSLEAKDVKVEIFHIGIKPISGCTACMKCLETNRCNIRDSVNVFLDLAESADGFVFGSPVHYAAPSGAITSFMDRAFYAGMGSGIFAYKPAAAVVSCRRAGSTAAFDQLNKYFTISNMPVVSSQYWNMVHGAKPEDVAQDLEGLQTMRTLGQNMAWLLRSIEAGRAAGIALPERETPVRTNFIR